MPPGTETLCSGCNLPGLAAVYMCWQCQFFLHEQCFQAARSLINHPSHPSHPLALVPYPTYPSATFYCNSCTHPGAGFSYTCPACDFDLHLHCAAAAAAAQLPYPNDQSNQTPHFSPQYAHNSPDLFSTHQPALGSTPSSSGVGSGGGAPPRVEVLSSGGKKPPQPQGVKHFSHQHPLNFCEVKEGDKIACSGCEKPIWGSAYSCGQTRCKFNLHNQCFGLPRELQHKSHPDHPLALLTSPPYKPNGTGIPSFSCDACLSAGSAFLYHCSACNFDLHVDCAFMPETAKTQNHDHRLSLIYALPDFKEQEGLVPTCDVCLGKVDLQRSWFYCCQECDYGTHLECLNGKAAGPREEESEQDLLAAAVLQLQMLQLQSQLNALSKQGGSLKY
ncbi:uncharacterized protein LOC127801586 [Diospyros lotus]|uniref:uncharacterized protein LOC127801586 n=1 Tax=Diospyros lotus TaxID=55363 RepID=UPI002256F933|nr:uncharacterized protein LOC127801586 [Diospyros lotus]